MSSVLEVLFFSAIGGVISLVGGFILLSSKKRAASLAMYATPFAAGALLAAAFTDLLPEALHAGDAEVALRYALFGILGFFLLERSLRFFHHHHDDDSNHDHADPAIPLIVIGDTLHNFIDGIAIAAGFLVDTPTGIAVTLAVAAHEIPQEIGDFGLLLSKGMKRKKVLLVNLFSAIATSIAAVSFYVIGDRYELPLDIVLGLTAGMFIYIATSDIIPSLHKTQNRNIARAQTALLVAGVVVVATVSSLLHEIIESGEGHSESEHSHEVLTDDDHNYGDDHHSEDHEDAEDHHAE